MPLFLKTVQGGFVNLDHAAVVHPLRDATGRVLYVCRAIDGTDLGHVLLGVFDSVIALQDMPAGEHAPVDPKGYPDGPA